ncbi:hypothetical protein Q5P01_000572 [Channa striata]|uniref:Ig-like domain-containing protein n=1 Tax=Channa striata TaxID=64152 RepID=A0AA88IH14_CHASR|nr:hypothetical protein Q5P01_000572 [Channa striata]
MRESRRVFYLCLLTFFVKCSTLEEIKAKPGDDVTLQCQGPRQGAIELLEWSKHDLKDYVFYFRDERSYENFQHPAFHGRVELRDPQMKDGDMSVILKNVNIKDTGTYECYVGDKLITVNHLTVTDSTWTCTGLSVSVLSIAAVVGLVIFGKL